MRFHELTEQHLADRLTRRNLLRAIFRYHLEQVQNGPSPTWEEFLDSYTEVGKVLSGDTLTLYRGLASEDVISFDVRSDDFQEVDDECRSEVESFARTIRFDALGVHWTWDKECAVPGGMLGGGSGHDNTPDIIIEIEVSLKDVDIPTTLYHNLTVYEEEKEIRLLPNRRVHIKKVYPGCLDLPFPKEGNTGAESYDTRASTLRDLEPYLGDGVVTEGASGAPFRLHPNLNPDDFVMTNSLRGTKKWKARVHVGDGTRKPGLMDDVGYVMINIHDNTIVPIPRADEHHRGYELMYDYATGKFGAKQGIRPGEFVPVWQHGKNYVHGDDPKMLEAVKRHLAYGGKDGVIAMHDYNNRENNGVLHLSDYVASEGKFGSTPGELAPLGQRVYEALRTLSVAVREARGSTEGPRIQPAFKQATAFIKTIAHITVELGLEWDYVQGLPKEIRRLQKDRDVQGLEELIFGFHGLKNKIHNRMKNPNTFQIDDVKGVWGDIDYAVNLLADF